MTETQVYGIDGLFHNIIKQSRIMNGRYAVLQKGSHDLSMNNLLSGLDIPKTKYPAVFCLPPASELENTGAFEQFNFRMIFACISEATGDNKIKYPDKTTNTSLAKTVQDWQDMKTMCLSFMKALSTLHPKVMKEFRLSQSTSWRITRFASLQNDNLNGVLIFFSAGIFDRCEYGDIELSDVNFLLPQTETSFH